MNNVIKISFFIFIMVILTACGATYNKSYVKSQKNNYTKTLSQNHNNLNYKTAAKYYKQEDYKTATTYYLKYLKNYPNDWYAYNRLAWSYYMIKDYKNAEISFIKSIKNANKINKVVDANYKGLGKSLYLQGKYDDSIKAFKKYISIKSNDPDIYNWLAYAYYNSSKPEQAIKYFKKSISYDKKNKYIYENYEGLINSYFGTKQYNEAIPYIKKYIRLKPNNWGYNILAWAYFNLNKFDESIDNFILANKYKESYESYRGLGLCEFKRKNYYQSKEYFYKALRLASKEDEKIRVKIPIVEIYLKKGNYKKAEEIFKDLPFLGITLQSDYFGVKILNVVENSPAYFSGIKKGDIIISINDTSIKQMSVNDIINNIIRQLPPRKWATIKFIRHGELQKIKIYPTITADLPKKYNKQVRIASNNMTQITKNPYNIHKEKWALIIGISKYRDNRIPSLRYASSDARSLYNWLISSNGGRYSPTRVKLLINEKATFKNIRNALFTWLKQPLKEDMVTIFYAGHGSSDSPDTPENLYLLPYDADYNNIATTGFPMWDFETALKRFISADQVVIIADACHSGGIGGGFDRQRRGARALKANKINTSLEKLTNAGKGVAILSSASDDQLAQEGSKWGGGHGVFTYYLLQGLKGKADYNGDNLVSMGELIPYVSEKVRRATYNSQSPTISGKFDPALTISK
jgi:tetratricopeptide (TPR) repeat protein